MSLEQARAHLIKAEEFLAAAQSNARLGWINAATSNAVSCGINAKDAIFLTLTGRSAKSDNHADAVKELQRAGAYGAELAPTFSRLLKTKSKSQYQGEAVAASDARRAIDWAQRMYDGARLLVH